MDEGRWLQRVALTLSSQMAGGKPSKFFVNQRSEVIEGLFMAIGPLNQQARHIVGGRHVIENPDLTSSGILHLFARTISPYSLIQEKTLVVIDFLLGFRVCK